ncbi:site-2 protease family protein [Candidatus Falkowbacteria bacterium]|nr:site-2 protease family protein [Candidatus Falkowbacteria bacterium]
MIINLLFSEPIVFVLWVLSVIYGLTIHEFSHVLAAYRMGDHTGKDMGRLTLNPLAHIDWLGFFMLLMVGFGWGNPAPYNPYNLKYQKWGPALVAVAGPLSNIISLFVFGFLFKFLRLYTGLAPDNLLLQFLMFLALINLVLLVFNLIPIPPLDGSQVLFAALPSRYNDFKYLLAKNGPIILILLVLADSFLPGVSIFSGLFNWVWNLIYWLF